MTKLTGHFQRLRGHQIVTQKADKGKESSIYSARPTWAIF